MGGIGKTELAIQYCYKHLKFNDYPGGICWLRARDEDIGSQIVDFAFKKLGLEAPENLETIDRVEWLWERWREGKKLIILDDVTNYGEIKPYLPPQPSEFKVLITTRLKLGLSNPLYLEVLSEKEALELLSELINSEKVDHELSDAKELCQRLGYLPLALQLVGRYIKTRKISFAEELARLEAKRLTHDSMNPPENDPGWVVNINRGIEAAFELTWDELSNSARDLGCLLSLFALAPIPWSLVESTIFQKQKKSTSKIIKILKAIDLSKKKSLTIRNKEELEKARTKLENFHLLQNKDNFQLHQLIQEFLRNKQEKLPNANEQKTNLCNATVEMASEIPQITTLSDIARFTPYISHLAETANSYLESVDDDDLYRLFTGLVRFYGSQGAYSQALPWCERCLSVCQERLGGEHPDIASSLNDLAYFYNRQGRYEEAKPLYLEALEMRKKLLGEEHPEVAASLTNLAVLYENQGRYEKVEPLVLEALKMRKRLLGEEHPDIASSLNDLAYLYDNQRRYEEAEPLHLEALKMRKKLLGEEHPYVASSLINLAILYNKQERYEEAEPLYLEALEMNKKLLGEKHPYVASSLINIAILYDRQGRYEEAEPLFLEALEIHKKLLGEEHPNTTLNLYWLAHFYHYSQKKYDQAETLYLEALEIYKKTIGENHPTTIECKKNYQQLKTQHL